MCDNVRVKISGFGSALRKPNDPVTELCGSPLWAAPEILRHEAYDESCDVYSFAIVLWEAVAWAEPYGSMDARTVVNEVARGLRPVIPPACPADFAQLLADAWEENPALRPNFSELLQYLKECG
jgi:serine/threonine protein kinase